MEVEFPYYSIGHFINEPQNKTEFEILRFEEIEEEPDVEDPHKHTFYEIIWVENGRSRQVIDYQEFEILPNTLFFISPGQVHHFEEWQSLLGGSIFFTENFFLFNQQNKDKLFELSFLDNFYANPVLQPDVENFQEILVIIQLLHAERRRENYSASIAQSLLNVLLLQIQRCFDQQARQAVSKKYIVLFKGFKTLIDQRFQTDWTVSDYAQELNITQHHLNYITKQVAGKTASEMIRARSFLEAKRLLTFTDHTVSEIAASLSFFDNSYFAKLFKAETGLSPLKFKSLMTEKYRGI